MFKPFIGTSCLLCLLLCLPLAGQGDPASERYVKRVWTTKDGLPQDTIYSLAQDLSGYLWIGTDSGVVRFDGAGFEIFDNTNTYEIKNNSIPTLLGAEDGAIWIGTYGGGVTVYRNGRFRTHSTATGLPSDFIWALAEDGKGAVWIGTIGGGLIRADGRGFVVFNEADGLSSNIIKALCVTKSGTLWAGTERGLTRLANAENAIHPAMTRFTTAEGLADDHVMAVTEDRSGDIWVGTANGLNRIRRDGVDSFTHAHGLASNLIRSLYEDRAGRLWVATDGGLCRRVEGRFKTLERLADDSLMALLEDREGNLWIGSSGQGLSQLHEGNVAFYRLPGPAGEFAVGPIFEDTRKRLWVGTNGGGIAVVKFDPRRPALSDVDRLLTSRSGLNSDFVNAIHSRRKGVMWIGTREGLMQRSGPVPVDLWRGSGMDPVRVTAIHEDRDGAVWCGTYGSGIVLMEDDRFTPIDHRSGLGNDFVLSITEDRAGDVWIGTHRGLNRFRGRKMLPLTGEVAALKHTVYDILADDGFLWLGTNGGGLIRIENGRSTTYDARSGLPCDVIYRILEDGHRNLWLGSNRGIFRIEKRQLDRFAAGEISTVQSLHLQEDDGLRSSVCSGGFQPAGCRGRDGTLYFPTREGIAVVRPEEIRLNPVSPTVLIKKVWVNGILTSPDQTSFPPRVDRLEIAFTAVNLTSPEKVGFSYRLYGLEEEWTDTKARAHVVYHNLPSGKYRFRVIACNNHGVWNHKGASFHFRIRYVFYRSVWFIALLMLVAIVSTRFLKNVWVRRRQARLEAAKKYKQSSLSPLKSQDYLRHLQKMMTEHHLYRDPEISLAALAEQMGIPPKHLSQIINERLGQNFKNFINRYRVEEAKIKILDPREKDFVLLKIAYDVGFNSKSVFNAAFKKHAGMSPTEYRRKYGREGSPGD